MSDYYARLHELTNLDSSILNEIDRTRLLVASHDLKNCIDSNSDFVLDIGKFGSIILNEVDNKVTFRFMPSEEFKNILFDTIKNKESALIKKAEDKVLKEMNDSFNTLL